MGNSISAKIPVHLPQIISSIRDFTRRNCWIRWIPLKAISYIQHRSPAVIIKNTCFGDLKFWAKPRKSKAIMYYIEAGCNGNKVLSRKLDLAQDLPNMILFHYLWVKTPTRKYFFKILKWPEMCPLGQILAQDFEIAAVT